MENKASTIVETTTPASAGPPAFKQAGRRGRGRGNCGCGGRGNHGRGGRGNHGRGGRGNRGRGGRGNQVAKSGPSADPFAQPGPSADPFAPKALGGTPTTPKDDPIIDASIFIDGVSGFVERRKNQKFSLDFSQFMTLIEESYKAQITCDRILAKFIAPSVFRYYMIILFWRRIYQISSRRGFIDDFLRLQGSMPDSLPVPKEVKIYLDCIGNLKDSEKQDWIFNSQAVFTDAVFFNAKGSFGRVDVDTHILYETIPSPLIALLNIRADVIRTSHAGVVHWQLPDNLTPLPVAAHQPGNPTLDLLGYNYARKLTTDQLDVIRQNGIDIENAGAAGTRLNVNNVANIPLIPNLISYVAGQLRKSKCPMPLYDTSSTTGSLAQTPQFIKLDKTFNENVRISEKLGVTRWHTHAPPHVAAGAVMFRYRIKRTTANDQTDGFCYSWQDNNHVFHIPQTWRDNGNSIYNLTEKWNLEDFNQSQADGRTILTDFAIKAKRKELSKLY